MTDYNIKDAINRFEKSQRDPIAYRKLCSQLAEYAQSAQNNGFEDVEFMIQHIEKMYREWYFVNFKTPMA